MFDYYLSIARKFQGDVCDGINDITVSDDLWARIPGGPTVTRQGDVCSVASIPFGGTVSLGVLGAGERLVVRYVLAAENIASESRTPELGYQALVGDPFGVSGSGGIRISAAAAPSVPEPPPMTLLLIGGLAALGGYRMTRA